MAKAIGIDLGTTNSVVAVMEGGKPTVIINSEGSRLTPSVVAFTKTGERLVGQIAKRQAVLNPENTIYSANRFIGRRYSEVQSELKNVPYKVVAGPNDAVRFDITGKQYAPEEISALVLRKLADDAAKYLGEKVGDGLFEVRSTSGDTHLGGDDFDKRLVDWMAEEFRRDQGIDLRKDRQALQRLTEAAEKAKIELSSAIETTISLPFVTADATGPKHLEMNLTRAKFDQLTADLVERCVGPVKRALEDAKVTEKDIDEVILVGGSTRIPAVQTLVRRLTGGKEANQSVNPDEVVAVGAAIQAGVLAGEVKNVLLLDVTPLSLGVETLGGVMTKLIERNTTIPARKSETFSTAEDNQAAVDIHVLQGERELARDNRTLGNFRLEGIQPAPRGAAQIEVTFDIDANGILTVTAKDKQSGKEQKITISGSTQLAKEEIDRMVADAQSHADEDRRRRDEVEARNNADSIAYQVERQIRDLGDRVALNDKARAEQLIAEIRELVKNNSSDIARLRQLTGDLQQVAYGLAAAGGGGQSTSGGGQGGGRPGSDDDVIDAEFKKT